MKCRLYWSIGLSRNRLIPISKAPQSNNVYLHCTSLTTFGWSTFLVPLSYLQSDKTGFEFCGGSLAISDPAKERDLWGFLIISNDFIRILDRRFYERKFFSPTKGFWKAAFHASNLQITLVIHVVRGGRFTGSLLSYS